MNTPTHDEISRQAYQLWRNHGCPTGRDNEFWLEAERKLNEDSTAATRGRSETSAENAVEYQLSPAQMEQKSIQAARQKETARAPQVAQHTAPKPLPAEMGKPLWPRPQSS